MSVNTYGLSNTIEIEGDTIDELVDLLMTEPTYLDKFVDMSVVSMEILKPKFKIHTYLVGELPNGSMQWENPESKNTYEEDWEQATALKPIKVYFDKSVVVNSTEMDKLIVEHSGYMYYVKLVNDVVNAKKMDENKHRVEQAAIKKQNDIYMLAKMIKHNEDFEDMLNKAKELQIEKTSVIDETGFIKVIE